jgi:thiamine biosynthesis lipoprotein
VTTLHRTTFEVMGTVVSLATPGSDIQAMRAVVRDVLVGADQRFSTFRSDSELSRLRRDRGGVPTMSDDMQEVLTECLSLQRRTHGAFRPTDPRGVVDTTGYVKGWAMARAERALRQCGWKDWNLGVGGDVVVAGHNGDRPWHVAVRHPMLPGAVAEVLAVSDAAVATSGEYERGRHIWGSPQPSGGSVTVVGPRIEVADALATALWVCADTAPRWLRGFPEYGVLRLAATGERIAA